MTALQWCRRMELSTDLSTNINNIFFLHFETDSDLECCQILMLSNLSDQMGDHTWYFTQSWRPASSSKV